MIVDHRARNGLVALRLVFRLSAIATVVLVFVYDLGIVYFDFGVLATLAALVVFPLTALGLPILEAIRGNWLPVFTTIVFVVVAGGSQYFEETALRDNR